MHACTIEEGARLNNNSKTVYLLWWDDKQYKNSTKNTPFSTKDEKGFYYGSCYYTIPQPSTTVLLYEYTIIISFSTPTLVDCSRVVHTPN